MAGSQEGHFSSKYLDPLKYLSMVGRSVSFILGVKGIVLMNPVSSLDNCLLMTFALNLII